MPKFFKEEALEAESTEHKIASSLRPKIAAILEKNLTEEEKYEKAESLILEVIHKNDNQLDEIKLRCEIGLLFIQGFESDKKLDERSDMHCKLMKDLLKADDADRAELASLMC
jgi:hypothetical protein